MPAVVFIDGMSLTWEQAEAISLGARLELQKTQRARIEANRAVVEALIHSDQAIYGLNTGFGYFAHKRIAHDKLIELQENIVRSHAAGYGTPLKEYEARLCTALRINVLARGLAGVRYKLLEALRDLLNAGITPMIPEHGSVGASGDLAPLAHVGLALLGEGQVWYKGQPLSAQEALAAAELTPYTLAEKEGLSLINGTQAMLAVGGLAVWHAQRITALANQVVALSYEALCAHVAPLDPRIHQARGQIGQSAVAESIARHLEGSYLYKQTTYARVQDPYSLRCAPQVHGASLDALHFALSIVTRELNAVTDNPLVFTETKESVSGGNFHGQPLALAFDIAAMALAELGNIAERRLELLLNPHMSNLNAFLAPQEGLQSGYMSIQYLSASLVNENKGLANPACTDSIPGNVGIEDHVSMGMTAARKLKRLAGNVEVILAVEALAAAQAVDMRKVIQLGRGSKKLYAAIRSSVPYLSHDRIIAEDIKKAVQVIKKVLEEKA